MYVDTNENETMLTITAHEEGTAQNDQNNSSGLIVFALQSGW